MIEPIFLNSEQIAEVVNIGKREIRNYVERYGMPAFQEREGGRWKARKAKLEQWAEKHERSFLD